MAYFFHIFKRLFLAKIFLAQEISHLFIFVDEIEHFRNPSHFRHEIEQISFDITTNVQKHSRIKFFNGFS